MTAEQLFACWASAVFAPLLAFVGWSPVWRKRLGALAGVVGFLAACLLTTAVWPPSETRPLAFPSVINQYNKMPAIVGTVDLFSGLVLMGLHLLCVVSWLQTSPPPHPTEAASGDQHYWLLSVVAAGLSTTLQVPWATWAMYLSLMTAAASLGFRGRLWSLIVLIAGICVSSIKAQSAGASDTLPVDFTSMMFGWSAMLVVVGFPAPMISSASIGSVSGHQTVRAGWIGSAAAICAVLGVLHQTPQSVPVSQKALCFAQGASILLAVSVFFTCSPALAVGRFVASFSVLIFTSPAPWLSHEEMKAACLFCMLMASVSSATEVRAGFVDWFGVWIAKLSVVWVLSTQLRPELLDWSYSKNYFSQLWNPDGDVNAVAMEALFSPLVWFAAICSTTAALGRIGGSASGGTERRTGGVRIHTLLLTAGAIAFAALPWFTSWGSHIDADRPSFRRLVFFVGLIAVSGIGAILGMLFPLRRLDPHLGFFPLSELGRLVTFIERRFIGWIWWIGLPQRPGGRVNSIRPAGFATLFFAVAVAALLVTWRSRWTAP